MYATQCFTIAYVQDATAVDMDFYRLTPEATYINIQASYYIPQPNGSSHCGEAG
jgi:hypothetical protein